MTDAAHPEIRHVGAVTIVALGPEYDSLDGEILDSVRELLLAAVDAADPPRLVVDLSHTKFMGSSFIQVLFAAWEALKRKGQAKLALAGMTNYCEEVIQITHLNQVWPLFADSQLAVKALSPKK